MKRFITFLFLACTPLWAQAWWNEEWAYRMPIAIDTGKTGGTLVESQRQVPVLVRLHVGNFEDFFSVQENLSDLRFIAEDDKTPLDFQVEHFDLVSQVLLVWVMMPEINPDKMAKIHMYYGNTSAVTADKKQGMYDAATALVVHFNDMQGSVGDSTANKTPLSLKGGEVSPTGLIGRAAKFGAETELAVQSVPSLRWSGSAGSAMSFWLKVPAASQGRIFTFAGAAETMQLDLAADALNLQLGAAKLNAANAIAPDQWQHVSISAQNGQLQLLVNGKMLAQGATSAGELTGSLIFGRNSGAGSFSGELDELNVYTKAMPASFFEFVGKNQGMNDPFMKITPSEQLGAGGDADVYMVIIKSMDHISWVVVIVLSIMMVIGWIIMVAKWLYLRAANKDNRAFLREYEKLGNRNPAMLDYDAESETDEYSDMGPIIQAIFGRHDHYQSSPIFHLFHRGMKEVKTRMGTAVSAEKTSFLAPQAVSSIRAALDAQMTREIQTMQSKMTFLTMSVSGGPFIGLFGTVAGVMITFGAIAAAGDVNINAIAPGVSAALVATVGGLLVAIPAMFGYNYLSGIIKDTIADMRVFADEYIAKLAEYYGEQ
ncbi:MAG: hypothetical protein RL497_349 [Pseudomonadota bacterium]